MSETLRASLAIAIEAPRLLDDALELRQDPGIGLKLVNLIADLCKLLDDIVDVDAQRPLR